MSTSITESLLSDMTAMLAVVRAARSLTSAASAATLDNNDTLRAYAALKLALVGLDTPYRDDGSRPS